jgi:hypothetical protein
MLMISRTLGRTVSEPTLFQSWFHEHLLFARKFPMHRKTQIDQRQAAHFLVGPLRIAKDHSRMVARREHGRYKPLGTVM